LKKFYLLTILLIFFLIGGNVAFAIEHEIHHGTNEINSTAPNDHGGQAGNQKAESHDGGHGAKEVKEVNIKPWVNTFFAYNAGVLLLAFILKKGKGQSNELVS
jgi:hypothetical protein